MLVMFGIGLGETLQPSLQGLTTFATGSRDNAMAFTTLAMVDEAAELIAGPLTARLMAVGRTAGHPSDGVCFFSSSVCGTFLFSLKLKISAYF